MASNCWSVREEKLLLLLLASIRILSNDNARVSTFPHPLPLLVFSAQGSTTRARGDSKVP